MFDALTEKGRRAQLGCFISDVFDCLLFVSQIRTRAISAKGMTLVSPLQLLLFACKKISSNGDIVELDDW